VTGKLTNVKLIVSQFYLIVQRTRVNWSTKCKGSRL